MVKHWQVLTCPFLSYSALALFPFILVKKRKFRRDPVLINHERIHFRQQLEMLVIFFYVAYVVHYVINLIRYQNHDKAYRNICFEKEAYRYEADLQYVKTRKAFSWMK